jgi:hypothetical protein
MKKIVLLILFFLAIPLTHAVAQGSSGFVPLAPIPGLTDTQTVGSVIGPDSLAKFFNNLYKYLVGIAATLAVIEIIWGGLLYSTQDSVGNKEEGKEKIRMAIFGLILVLSPVLVFSIINPSILNLSLNLTKIDLPAGVATQEPLPTVPVNAAKVSLCNRVGMTTEERAQCADLTGQDRASFTAGPGATDDIAACKSKGGEVATDPVYVYNGDCSGGARTYGQKRGYEGCNLLSDGKSVCFSK